MKVKNKKGDLTNIYIGNAGVLTLECISKDWFAVELEVEGESLTFETNAIEILLMQHKIARFMDIEE